jgi:DNA-binding CsgD family transcriptional regulator
MHEAGKDLAATALQELRSSGEGTGRQALQLRVPHRIGTKEKPKENQREFRMRPRQLNRQQERDMLAEIRVGRTYTTKKIAERYGLTVWSLANYIRRARLAGRL